MTMRREQLEKMKVGDCFAKKSKYKTTIYRIKALDEYFYFNTDAMVFSREGIKTLVNEPMNAMYSDGFVPVESAEFDRIWKILTVAENAIAPLVLAIADRIDQAKNKKP